MITLAIVRTEDGFEIVNAKSEREAYEAVVGEAWSEETANPDFECFIIDLQPGQRVDLTRY